MMDSEPVFRARAKAVTLDDATIDKMVSKGVKSLANLAFLCGIQPGSPDDKDFAAAISNLLEEDPLPIAKLAPLRRLWFEANTLAISEVRHRYEKTEETQPRKLPLAERETRRQAQQKKLTGVKVEGPLEPSYALIDAMHAIREEEIIRFVDPLNCFFNLFLS